MKESVLSFFIIVIHPLFESSLEQAERDAIFDQIMRNVLRWVENCVGRLVDRFENRRIAFVYSLSLCYISISKGSCYR